jgi:hypothetical protein
MGRDDHAGRDPDRALQGRSLADGAKLDLVQGVAHGAGRRNQGHPRLRE